VRAAGSAEPVAPALRHAPVAHGGRAHRKRHQRTRGAVPLLSRAATSVGRGGMLSEPSTSAATARGGAPAPAVEPWRRLYEPAGFLPILLLLVVVVMALFVPHFLAVQNVFNVLRSSSYLMILAVGQMLVLIVGGFDLSVGAVVALTSVTSALVMAGLKTALGDEPSLVIALGVAAGLGSGLVVGLVNGLCVAFLRV